VTAQKLCFLEAALPVSDILNCSNFS